MDHAVAIPQATPARTATRTRRIPTRALPPVLHRLALLTQGHLDLVAGLGRPERGVLRAVARARVLRQYAEGEGVAQQRLETIADQLVQSGGDDHPRGLLHAPGRVRQKEVCPSRERQGQTSIAVALCQTGSTV